jgi:hypothetical protein
MSVELYLYSTKPALAKRKALRDALGKKGWLVLFLDPLVMTERDINGTVGSELLYGSRDAGPLNRAREFVLERKEKKLEDLFEARAIGACALDATSPIKVRKSEVGEGVPAEVAAEMTRTRSHYVVRTSAGRSSTSVGLQLAVWNALGERVGGLLSDPQSRECVRIGPKGRKILVPSEVAEDSPVDRYTDYFVALKLAGFAGDTPEKLSPQDLERLFAFTRKHFGAKSMEGLVMNQMTLETYKERKGKTFLKQNASWLSQIESKYTKPGSA